MKSNTFVRLGPPRLFFILNIIFENSEEIQIYSDQTWLGRQGSILHDSIYNGEIIDGRYERLNWSQVGFNDQYSLWLIPEIMSSPINQTLNGKFVLQDMPPIRAGLDSLYYEIDVPFNQTTTGILKPISVSTPVSGVHLFDIGQNMVGYCRIYFQGPRGVSVQIRHAEILTQPVVSTRYDRDIYYKQYVSIQRGIRPILRLP